MRSAARSLHLIVAWLIVAWLLVAGLATQVFLAGLGVFRSATSFATHRDFGYMLEALPFVLLVAGLAGRLGRRAALLAVAIFALFLLQSVFVALRGTMPEVAALHPLNGFLITFLAIVLARDAWLARRAPLGEIPAPAGPELQASIR